MTTRRTFILLLTAFAFGCDQGRPATPTTPTPPAGPFLITGHVTEFTTKMPAADLLIRLGTQKATTDAQGNYAITLDRGDYDVLIADIPLPIGRMYVTGPWTSGDLYINGLECAARYGAVTDARTGRPIADATVLGKTTDAQGWFRLDFYACNGCGTCNTTFFEVSAPGYKTLSEIGGRGWKGVARRDVRLEPN